MTTEYYMKLTALIFFIFLFSCNSKNIENDCLDNDSVQFELIKDSKDYMDFSDFALNYPHSDYFFDAINLYDKRFNDYLDSIGDMPTYSCKRNCASIDLKPDNTIGYEGMTISISSIHDSLLTFFINENDLPSLPEKIIVEDQNKIPFELSRGKVQLQFVKDSCDQIQSVILEINRSIKSYKTHLAQNLYSTDYKKLSKSKVMFFDSLMTKRLILFGFDKYYILPPPPPQNYEYKN